MMKEEGIFVTFSKRLNIRSSVNHQQSHHRRHHLINCQKIIYFISCIMKDFSNGWHNLIRRNDQVIVFVFSKSAWCIALPFSTFVSIFFYDCMLFLWHSVLLIKKACPIQWETVMKYISRTTRCNDTIYYKTLHHNINYNNEKTVKGKSFVRILFTFTWEKKHFTMLLFRFFFFTKHERKCVSSSGSWVK